MSGRPRLLLLALTGLALTAAPWLIVTTSGQARPIDISAVRELVWRPIGPLRTGRVTAAGSAPSASNVFYVAVSGGGLWKTTDYGQSWRAAFEHQPTGTISAIAVAASHPETVYAGTGSDDISGTAMPGDGLFASTDGGTTWTRTAPDVRGTIARIDVHPASPDRLLVAVVETSVDADASAGVFASTDGGRTVTRVLATDARGGQLDLARHPAIPDVVYALADEGFRRSEDGGATWRPTGLSLPATASGSVEVAALAVTPARPDRIYALVGLTGGLELYRSDDRGNTFARLSDLSVSRDPGTRAGLTVSPTDPDLVFVLAGDVHRSTDGGATFARWAADVDTGHDRLWINEARPDVMLLAGRSGVAITVNGGSTWSARHTLPSADVTTVATDRAFPYRVCGTLRDGPALCVSSDPATGTSGVTQLLPAAAGTSRVAPDPNEPDLVFLGGPSRYDRRTEQLTPLGTSGELTSGPLAARAPERPAAVLFGPDGKTLYFGTETLWRSTNGGLNWMSMGPAREDAPTAGRGTDRIAAIAVSDLAPRIIWIGGETGSVHVTRDDGGSWRAATPSGLPDGARITSLAASRFDANGAYVTAALDRALAPLVWRTRDGGDSWVPVSRGLPAGRVHVLHEDAYRRGLLFAGTDRGVFVSFDDAEQWQPLRLNLPATPVRDLTIEQEDVVIATGGRGFWVLDDISVLRQVTADVLRAEAFLFRPAVVWRVRAGGDRDPARLAPGTDAAAFDYLVGPGVSGELTLEVIATTTGERLRRFSSEAPAGGPDWIDPSPGLHRRVWDLRYAAVPPADPGAPPVPSLRVPPGAYQVRLTANGSPLRQAISIRLDPRVRLAAADQAAHFALAKAVDDRRRAIHALRDADGRLPVAAAESAATLDALARMLDQFDGRPSAALEAAVAAATR
jgi:photosystem II stability/assembly factor-like uncharacterized protein